MLVLSAGGAITVICRRAVADEGGDCRAARIPAPAVRGRSGTEWGVSLRFVLEVEGKGSRGKKNLTAEGRGIMSFSLKFVSAELTFIVSDSKGTNT